MKSWIILTVRPQRERKTASAIINDLGLSVCVPCARTHRKARGKNNKPIILEKLVPILPGYVFVGSPGWFPLHDLRATDGVTGWVQFDGVIGRLTDAEIDRIRRMAKSASAATPKGLSVGDEVNVTEGAFRNLKAVLSAIGKDTVKLDVMILGRVTEVTLPAHHVERAA